MVRIAFIAPDMLIYEHAQHIARELGLEHKVRFHMAEIRDALAIAKKAEHDGVDVIISRGGTADLIFSAGLRTPIVNIPLNIQDLAKALYAAKQLTQLERPRVALIAFPRVHWGLEAFAALLDMDLHVYHSLGKYESIIAAARKAVEEGADVLVGGISSVEVARMHGIPGIIHESGADSLRQAFWEANKIVYARTLEKIQAQRLKIIVEHSRDGIFTLDAEGRVQTANPAARRMFKHVADPIGLPFSCLVPRLDRVHCWEDLHPVRDEVVQVQGMSFLINATPYGDEPAISGVIISVQPVRSITELEGKIRRSLYTKGMAAKYNFEDIVGVSAPMRQVLQTARQYALTGESVLISGETGTGKELCAHSLHSASPRCKGPFVAVNCAALPPTLLESELFGYEEGAFTGASRKGKAGLFELAHQGTIFLDEIGEMDNYGQTRLLRVLEDRCTMRLGGDKYIPVDIRLISASNVDLAAYVRQGRFRKDLYYRLNVLSLHLPPLRERTGDLALLIEHFAQTDGVSLAFSPAALRCLQEYDWPGNVRELRNLFKRLSLFAKGASVSVQDLEACLDSRLPQEIPSVCASVAESFASGEYAHILHALRACRGHQGRAAALLGMNRSTLYRKMRRLRIAKYTD